MTASSYILFDFSVGVNADRVKVLLSVLRHCPLIDANHSSSFMHLGDTHYEKNQNVNKKKQVLVIYGEDDGNHTFLLRFFFFRCDQIKKKKKLGITPAHLLEELKSYIPDAKVKIFANTDHSMFLQQPKKVFDVIYDFVNSTSQTSNPQRHHQHHQHTQITTS